MMSMAVDENQILERRLDALNIVYQMAFGKEVSERFLKNIHQANASEQDKIRIVNNLIDKINQVIGLKKYLQDILEA